MNEVTRIHLARTAYDIDLVAKKELERYLTAVRKSLGSEVDAMEDIEIRMTEILAERGVLKDSVITEPDVKDIIEQLGEPKSFAPDGDERVEPTSPGAKKYYRDTDNAVLGGVIAGLAAYTGWDVTLLRVLAVVLAIVPSWGTLIIVYIVVWICAPEAKTVGEKLEMHGQPVNLESIKDSARKIGERAERVGREAAEGIQAAAPTVGASAAKIAVMVVGIIGIVVSSMVLAAVLLTSIWALVAVANLDIAARPLLLVIIGLAMALITTLIMYGFVLSGAFISGKFDKRLSRGLAGVSIAALVFAISLIISGAVWLSMVHQDGLDKLTDALGRSQVIEVKNHGGKDRVRVEFGPMQIRVDD
ncbi:MAG: PspC domain-containing protein [Candidatus Nomurabacteria bacterium]|jgi:phage shock protein PspC (stress-responsive transcriptional regulator)|nr:PspC domain-containing protein [Candidatus Nomurabacteria bacterium]